MELVINLLVIAIMVLAILNVVVRMAQMDRRYARRVRQEFDDKSYLRGDHWGDR